MMKSDIHEQLDKLAEANVRMVFLTDAYEKLRGLEKDLSTGGDIEVFYELFITELVSLFNAKYGALGLFSESGKLNEFITVGMDEETKNKIETKPVGKGLLAKVYTSGVIFRVDEISKHQDSCGFPEGHPAMKSLLAAPLIVDDVQKGVVYLSRQEGAEPFSESDEEILKLVVMEIEHVLERKVLLSQLAAKNLLLHKERAEQEYLLKTIGEIQNQLMQADKMASIGQLAAGVAHEINNPVGYINSNLSSLDGYIKDLFGFIDILSETSSAKGVSQEELEKLQKDIDYDFIKDDIKQLLVESKDGVSRVIKIVKDLKDFSHVDEEEWQWADLQKGIDSTLNVVNNEIKYKAEVIKEYGDIPEVECIASQLNQVFMNLLVNAAHAIETKGTITIQTGLENNETIWVKFIDTGSGIEQKNINKLFEPFFSTKPVGQGTGLGLSLSYGIIQKHGGEIEVKSEMNKGTQFTISLPIKQKEKTSEN